MRSILAVAVFVIIFTGSAVCYGQDTDKERFSEATANAKIGDFDGAFTNAKSIGDPDLRRKALDAISDEQAEKFWSVWGVALITNFDFGDKKPVKSASIINGVVRVEAENEIKYGLGLEVHRFIWGNSWGATDDRTWSGAFAIGPYVSVLPGTNNIIDTIGAGIIIGFIGGRTSESEGNKFSMNIAIGGYVDPDTKVLADGFEDGKAPPAGETSVRFSSVAQYGIQGVLSFSYDF